MPEEVSLGALPMKTQHTHTHTRPFSSSWMERCSLKRRVCLPRVLGVSRDKHLWKRPHSQFEWYRLTSLMCAHTGSGCMCLNHGPPGGCPNCCQSELNPSATRIAHSTLSLRNDLTFHCSHAQLTGIVKDFGREVLLEVIIFYLQVITLLVEIQMCAIWQKRCKASQRRWETLRNLSLDIVSRNCSQENNVYVMSSSYLLPQREWGDCC